MTDKEMNKQYSRLNLIKLCRDGIVEEEKWNDRDTCSAQMQLGKAWALLRAGCEFNVDYFRTDSETIWIEIYSKGFNYFEYSVDSLDKNTFYIPTEKHLDESNGEDWY